MEWGQFVVIHDSILEYIGRVCGCATTHIQHEHLYVNYYFLRIRLERLTTVYQTHSLLTLSTSYEGKNKPDYSDSKGTYIINYTVNFRQLDIKLIVIISRFIIAL